MAGTPLQWQGSPPQSHTPSTVAWLSLASILTCCLHIHQSLKAGAGTQTRTLRSRRGELQTLLEACVENATRGPLFLEYLRFEPSSHLSAEELPREELGPPDPAHPSTALERYVDALKVRRLLQTLESSLIEAEAEPIAVAPLGHADRGPPRVVVSSVGWCSVTVGW